MATLRVGYINIQGNEKDKFNRLIYLLENDELDILFLGETWFTSHNSYVRYKGYVRSTTNIRSSGCFRSKGGTYLLANQRWKVRISSVETSDQNIVVTFVGGLRVAGVYIPPSLPPQEVTRQVQALGKVNVILGDWNCRFPELPTDSKSNTYTGR